jgi:DNA topoisomerase-3
MTSDAMRDALANLRDGADFAHLEEAARSRSEADWIVGMNATRAATIRLRSSFDGAVSLGRVQTPTLAIIARREEEIRAFVPEPYWLVDATFEAEGGRRYEGRFHQGHQPRLATAEEADAVVAAVRGRRGTITSLEKRKRTEIAPLLYDLTSLQREANTRFGFSARRTLAAAQRCYEEHKVLTYPRTSSRYLTSDMIGELKAIAGQVGRRREYAAAAAYVRGLDLLPLKRVVDDAKVGDHHAIIPTNSEHNVDKLSDDDRGSTTWWSAASSRSSTRPPSSRTRGWRPRSSPSCSARAGRSSSCPGWRGVYGELNEEDVGRRGGRGAQPAAAQARPGRGRRHEEVESAAKETKPPRRFSDASLLGAMETAGKLVDDDEAAEAMKESGHRHARHARGDHRAPHRRGLHRARRALPRGHGEGPERHPPARRAPAHLAAAHGRLGGAAGEDRGGRRDAQALHGGHREVRRGDGRRAGRQAQGRQDPRANLGPCPVCGHDIIENRKGYSCWSARIRAAASSSGRPRRARRSRPRWCAS